LDTIEVAVEVDFQEYSGVIGGPAGSMGIDTLETELSEIKSLNEGLNGSDRVVLRPIATA
jgi:hypothetical protein